MRQGHSHLGNLRQSFLVLSLGRLAERLCDDLVLSIDYPTRTLPLLPNLLQPFIPHVSDAKQPNILVFVDRLTNGFQQFLLVFEGLFACLRQGDYEAGHDDGSNDKKGRKGVSSTGT